MLYNLIFSATSYFKLNSGLFEKENASDSKIFVNILTDCVKHLRHHFSNMNDKHQYDLSLLFNAYTEKKLGMWQKKNNKFGFRNLFSDSGGLQVITLGKEIDLPLKQEIYKIQSISDYAMCFDEIPVGNSFINKTGKMNKTVDKQKIYFPDKMYKCAKKTTHNIKEQIEILKNLNCKTKVLFILQGNTTEDIIKWFDIGFKELEEWHWDHIGGIATGFHCIGSDPQHMIRILSAYKQLYDNYGVKYLKNNLHLLGVGSINRLKPVVYLTKNNFLQKDLKLSFDSSSLSMNFSMGTLYYDIRYTKITEKIMKKYYYDMFDFFNPIFKKHLNNIDIEKIMQFMLENDTAKTFFKSTSFINSLKKEEIILLMVFFRLRVIYQAKSFFEKLDKIIINDNVSDLHFNSLQEVYDMPSFNKWVKTYNRWLNSSKKTVQRFEQKGGNINQFLK